MALNFNINHLRYFYDSAKLGGIGLAAAKNFVTSSTISQAIKKLEQNLNVELLHHKKREFRITDEGRKLLEECEKIFFSINSFEREIKFSKDEPSGILRLASSHSVVSFFLLPVISKMTQKYTSILPSLRLGKTVFLRDLLINRETDLVLTVDDGNFQNFETIEIYKGYFLVIENTNENSNIENYSITKPRLETESLRDFYRKKYARELPVRIVFESWDLIARSVEHGLGRGLVPDFVFMNQNYKNIRPSKFNFKYPYRLIIAHRKNESLSTVAKIFLKFFNKVQ